MRHYAKVYDRSDGESHIIARDDGDGDSWFMFEKNVSNGDELVVALNDREVQLASHT